MLFRSKAAAEAADAVLTGAGVAPGSRVAITSGSRGIAGIAAITRAVVDRVRERGHRPVIVPAMGSHGGATAAGQRAILAHYGVTEESMGCPIDGAMDVVSLGVTRDGVDVFMARAAWDADRVLVLNRVKPHTDFHGQRESGIAKMAVIGLGKLEGAQACHRHVFGMGLGAEIGRAHV